MSATIEIITRVVTYRDADGEWMDGDSQEIALPRIATHTYEDDDAEEHGSSVEWAAHVLGRTDITEASYWPIGDATPSHAWLSGSYKDPYQGESRVTETTARLTHGWTMGERAEVFHRVIKH